MSISGRSLFPCLGAAVLATLLAACGDGGGTATCAAPPEVTAGAAWQHLGPADWDPACPSLRVRVPALAADERVALALVNAGGLDNATPTVALSGPLAAAAAEPPPLAALAAQPAAPPDDRRAALEAGRALATARRRAGTEAWLAEGAPRLKAAAPLVLAPAAAPALDSDWKDPRGPCVYSYTTGKTTRRPAKLRHVSAGGSALFYVTDDVWTGFQRVLAARPDLWATLDSYLEGTIDAARNPTGARRILPALHEAFGVESDVDGNGQLVFLFADLGADPGSGGFVVGYFDGTDVVRTADATDGCTGGGSNGADMLYLLDPCTFYLKGFTVPPSSCPVTGNGSGQFTYATVIDSQIPGTMAHELQHNVIFNTRCLVSSLPSCSGIDKPLQDLWLNEGLAMTAEDVAGFGLHDAGERSRVGAYLDCRQGPSSCYQGVSLTAWPTDGTGDPNGHYGGAHAFVRWHADQAAAGRAAAASASALTRALVASPLAARQAVAAASGLSFEEGYARFATAAMVSGEDALFASYPVRPAPDFSFAAGVPWSPLRTTVGKVRYTALPRPGDPTAPFPTSLMGDGWGAYVTAKGTGADVTLTLGSTAGVKPRAVVMRLRGNLPLP